MSLSGVVTHRTPRHPKGHSRARDFVLYIAIGVGIAAAAMSLGFFRSIDPNSFGKWLGLAVVTALVLVDAIRINRRRWSDSRFWLLIVVFAALECCVGFFVLRSVARVPTMLWAALIPLNYVALGAYLRCFLETGESDAR